MTDPQEKQASNAIQDVAGIGNTSARAIISVTGTGMGRFPSDSIFLPGLDYAPVIRKAPKSGNPAEPVKGMLFCGLHWPLVHMLP